MLYYKDTTLYSTASYPTCFWQSLSVLMAHRRITSNVMRLTSGTMSKDSPEAALFVQTSSCQGWELCICISIHVRNQLAGINLSNIFYAQGTMQALQVFEEAGIAGQCGVDSCGNAHNSSTSSHGNKGFSGMTSPGAVPVVSNKLASSNTKQHAHKYWNEIQATHQLTTRVVAASL